MQMEEEIPQFGELIVLDRYNEYGDDDVQDDSIPIIKNQKISIGRNVNNTMKINHPAISNIHCVIWSIQFDDNSIPLIYLKDMSLNGTYVNDVKIAKNTTVLLNHLDTIAIEYGVEFEYQSIFGNQESEYGEAIIHENSISKDLTNWSITNRILGNGTFGFVFVSKKKLDSRMCAVKVMKNKPNLQFEAKVLLKLSHPNIIQVHEAIQFDEHLYIVEDLICGGDLFSYLAKGNSLCSIPEFEALVIVYQIANALRYLHQNKITHRDLKLDNILLASPEPFTKIVLADFGIAKSISSTKRRMFTVVGTPEYCAPEVGFDSKKNPDFKRGILTKVSLVKRGYDSKCDIWSLGIITHIMLSGISPFYEDGNELNIIKSAKKGQLNFKLRQWNKVSNLAKDFVQLVLRVDINERLDVLQCLSHDWIQIHGSELDRIYKKILKNFT